MNSTEMKTPAFRSLLHSSASGPLSAASSSASSQIALGSLQLLQSFYGGEANAEVLKNLERGVRGSKSLQEAYEDLSAQDRQAVVRQVGRLYLEEILSISQNTELGDFWKDAGYFGLRLKQSDQLAAAGNVLTLVAQGGETVPAEVRESAKRELDAMTGRGDTMLRVGFLLSQLPKQATAVETIVPMMLGSAAFGAVRTTVLGRLALSKNMRWFTQGIGARLMVWSSAFATEASVFSIAGRGMRSAMEGGIAWDAKSMAKDLAGSALSLGAMRLFALGGNRVFMKVHGIGELEAGALTGWQSFSHGAFAQGSTFAGMLATHYLEQGFGLRKEVDGETAVTDTLGSMLSIAIGAQLGHGLLGRGFAEFQQRLEIQAGMFGQALGAAPRNRSQSSIEWMKGDGNGLLPGAAMAGNGVSRPMRMGTDDKGGDRQFLPQQLPGWRELQAPLPDGNPTSMRGEELIGEWVANAIKGKSEAIDMLARNAENGFLQAVFALEFISVSSNRQFPSEHRPPSEISTAASKALQSPKILEALTRQAGNSAPRELALAICALSGSTDAANRLTEMARIGFDGVQRSIKELKQLAIEGNLGAVAVLAEQLSGKGDPTEVQYALRNIAASFNPKEQSEHPPHRKTAMAAQAVLVAFDQRKGIHLWTDVWSHLGAERINFHLGQVKIAAASKATGGLVESPPDEGEVDAVRFLAQAEETAQRSPQAVFALESLVMSSGPLFPGEHRPPPQRILTAARQALQSPKISEALALRAGDSALHEQALEVCALYGNPMAAKRLFEMAEAGPDGTGLGGIRSIEQLQALAIQGKLGAVAVLAKLGETDRDPKAIIALDAIAKSYNDKAGEHPPHKKTSEAARQALLGIKAEDFVKPYSEKKNWPNLEEALTILDSYNGTVLVRSLGEVNQDLGLGLEVRIRHSDLLPAQVNLWQHLGPERRAFKLAQRKVAAAAKAPGDSVPSPRNRPAGEP